MNSSNLEFQHHVNSLQATKMIMIKFAIIISYLAKPFSASVSSDPLIRHKHTYSETGAGGGGWGGGLTAINNTI